jgi:uncharacterized protein YcnI
MKQRTSSHRPSTGAGRGRALRRALPALLAACASLAVPASAGAHAVVQPSASRPADLQRYTMTIPNEASTPTTQVALRVPEGIDFLLAEQQPGWKVQPRREGGRITELRWTGGSIPRDFFGTFHFIARNPVSAGPIDWKIVQTYTDKVQRWIGPPGSEEPAARTDISESASQQDVVAVNGGNASPKASPAAAADGGSQDEDEDDDGSDALPIALAAAALVAAVAALIVALRGRRRPA